MRKLSPIGYHDGEDMDTVPYGKSLDISTRNKKEQNPKADLKDLPGQGKSGITQRKFVGCPIAARTDQMLVMYYFAGCNCFFTLLLLAVLRVGDQQRQYHVMSSNVLTSR